MTGHALLAVVEQIAGALLLVVILSDVFMTVLYARIGTGLLSDHVSSGTWRMFKAVSNLLGQRKETFLSFCGPTVMVLILFVWSFGLVIANALILHPHLGHSILSANGPTPDDFPTAIYIVTGSISLLGANEFRPVTAPFRLFLSSMQSSGYQRFPLPSLT